LQGDGVGHARNSSWGGVIVADAPANGIACHVR
jgi:hypothetical protein